MAKTTYDITNNELVEIENNDQALLGTATDNTYQAVTTEKLIQIGKAGTIKNQDLEKFGQLLIQANLEIPDVITHCYLDMSRKNWSKVFLLISDENIDDTLLSWLASFRDFAKVKSIIFQAPTLIQVNW